MHAQASAWVWPHTVDCECGYLWVWVGYGCPYPWLYPYPHHGFPITSREMKALIYIITTPMCNNLRIQVTRDFKQYCIITIQLATRPKRTGLEQPLSGCNWLWNGLLKDQPIARLRVKASLRCCIMKYSTYLQLSIRPRIMYFGSGDPEIQLFPGCMSF